MQRRMALRLCVLLVGAVVILPAYAFVYDQGIQQVSQTIVSGYRGVKTVQVTGSIPNEMDSSQFGYFGAVFWNPTNDVYEVTRLEFNASSANNRVFRGIMQGRGFSYPGSGWVLNIDRKTVYLATTIIVQPHSAQEFYLKIRGNKETEAFEVAVRVTANTTVYCQTYQTKQVDRDAPFSVLWLGSGPTPCFLVSAQLGQETTFYVSLQEASGIVAIGSNGRLALQMSMEFTNIQDIGGTGWGSASIAGSNIEVNNTVPVKDSYITYVFRSAAPTYKGLYMINASFTGSPSEQPIASFCVRVIDS